MVWARKCTEPSTKTNCAPPVCLDLNPMVMAEDHMLCRGSSGGDELYGGMFLLKGVEVSHQRMSLGSMYQLMGVSVVVPLTSWKPSHQPAYGRQYSPNRWASPDTSGSFSPSRMVFEVPSVTFAILIRMAAGEDGGI